MKAIWNDKIIAQSDETIVVENNHYFPSDSIKKEYFENSEIHSVCPWKGDASYYTIVVGGKVNKDAAWYYPEPKSAAQEIQNYIAFWKGIRITED